MAWGDKGEEYRPDRCEHPEGDGCMWCCRDCNLDRHLCLNCGAITNHQEDPCRPECTLESKEEERVQQEV